MCRPSTQKVRLSAAGACPLLINEVISALLAPFRLKGRGLAPFCLAARGDRHVQRNLLMFWRTK